MIRIDYRLRTETMLYAGAHKPYGGNFMESRDHLSGGVVRGALAQFLLAQCPQGEEPRLAHPSCPERDGCRFYQLLGSGDGDDVIFTHAYPQTVLCERLGKRTWMLPVTAR